jgi:hypothetical protein
VRELASERAAHDAEHSNSAVLGGVLRRGLR